MTFTPMQERQLTYQGYVSDVRHVDNGTKLTIQVRQYDIKKAHEQLAQNKAPQPETKTYSFVSKAFISESFRSKSILYEQGDYHTARMTFFDAGLQTKPARMVYLNPHTIETSLMQKIKSEPSTIQRFKSGVKSLVEKVR